MKKVINIIVLMFLVVLFICNSVYAATIPVTDENLIASFQKFVKSEANEENYKISVSNNVITVSVDNENYALNYDLTNKPTFSLEVPIEKGMSYDDFKKQTDNLILPMLGYIAVADIQGIKMEDASTYFLFSYLGSAFNGSFSSENSYIIVDDLNASEGVTIEKTEDSKTIYTSEFGDRIIEYVDSMYKEKQNISDASGINSFSFSVEKQDTTETSRKLISTLSVNIDADFSKINGYVDGLEDAFTNKDITKENADYTLALKVGQKCKIESIEKITGHELYNSGCIELSEDYTQITAIKSGVTNGYLYIGNNNEKKSIYIMVEENTDNSSLETITLKIDNVSDKDIAEENTQKDSETKVDNELNIDTLPRTGKEINGLLIVLYIIFGTSSVGLLTLLLMKRKRK